MSVPTLGVENREYGNYESTFLSNISELFDQNLGVI